ncbi:Tn7 transposase TnsA N-terminal domain-containing protein [Oceanimonas baumannii]|uniref:TnsA endonuclease N-terminal domain-containing protein n=1 Tax=Oceanimonas baumannii TaxID=129578 RepID=UPI003A4DC40C|nr:Tn7 transposase TnsA N-terminal domain-containing protein [Oceanimonas baumannii]
MKRNLRYNFEGKKLPYTPDFKVQHRQQGKKFLELKPHKKTLNQDFRARFKAKQLAAQDQGSLSQIVRCVSTLYSVTSSFFTDIQTFNPSPPCICSYLKP